MESEDDSMPLLLSFNAPILYLEEFKNFKLNFHRDNMGWPSLPTEKSYVESTTATLSDSAAWLLTECSSYLGQHESSLFDNAVELAKEVISAAKLSSQPPSAEAEIRFQDKMFQLLGENCFDFLDGIMNKFSSLQTITSQSLTDSAAISASSLSSSFSEQQQCDSYNQDFLKSVGFSEEYLYNERLLGLQKGSVYTDKSDNLNHWKDDLMPEGTLVYHEKKGLPAGTEKKIGIGFEEVNIPAVVNKPIIPQGGLIKVRDLEPWAQQAFVGTKSLNTIQSIVFDAAYNSSQNLLICAPTGSGKTNIAMLAFLQVVKDHIYDDHHIDKSNLKVIYIAPMKALAQEVVSKFSERLKPLGLVVKEYTGDMQLTKQEVADSQLIVTTPEKYDVITRKAGDGSLGTLVQLVIIDEVHLLADERGAVIETIVARTHRYIESSQKRIRLVGLSATLPNYEDVAKFLRVNLKTGSFHFGSEYRPVPLSKTLVGITEKAKQKRNDLMNKQAYEKMMHALERDKQVMIFVHSRKETYKTAQAMIDLSCALGSSGILDNAQHEQYGLWKKQVDKSRSVEVQNLFYKGFGVHHAGMARVDRTMTEDLFQHGLIKVLCCTATLAWGVNLPAHTVIIKGTELYQPERGGFVDLSILDVLQIFGRAGRPQYDTTGHAVLITPHKSLDKYLGLLGNQSPIESGLIKCLADHMNAEIVNGTINNVKEAASWLSYSFLMVRMCKNPVSYGLTFDDVFEDPQLQKRRIELVISAAQTLDKCMMCRYDPKSGNLGCTDLGRVASHYYIKYNTIEAFNSMLNAHLNGDEALHVLCSSAEFDQLKLRPEELIEMETLQKQANIRIRVPVDETAGKVNVLLQGYLKQCRVNSFTLQSDTNYVAQNGARIARALMEICLKRGWSTLTSYYLELCKSIDRRVSIDQSPLRQFYYDELPRDVLCRLEDPKLRVDIHTLVEMDSKEVGEFIRNHKFGAKIRSLCRKLPFLKIDVIVQPITRGIIRLMIEVESAFDWTDKYHGAAEPFLICIEDGDNEYIYHSEPFILTKKQKDVAHQMDFTIPVREPLPPQYYIRVVSDRWLGCTTLQAVSFQHLILPDKFLPHTDLLNVHPVPKSALKNSLYESMYTSFTHFNPIQSQVFHALYHTDNNILVGAPTGSGKTIMSELAILRLLNTRPMGKIVYIAPLKALARERVEDWKVKLGHGLGLNVLELTGDITPDISLLNQANLLIVTPEKWDSISRGWQKRDYVKQVELIIIDEIHLLGVDRGAVLEIIVSRMRFVSAQFQRTIRFVGLSTALANPRDLADWLGVRGQTGVYNFRPAVRPVPMTIHIQGFPGKHYCPRMATMNKPCYATILEHSPTKPTLIFVSSRRQTRLTALDLISYCAADDNPKKFLHMSEEEISMIAETLKDDALKNTIVFGIAIHHAGLDNHDRRTVESLYLAGKLGVLVATSTLAWGINMPCHLVIVKGTEYFDGKIGRYVNFEVTDILQMMGRAGRPAFDDTGVAAVFCHEPMKNFYRKFLFEPFPVESSLHKQLHEHVNAEIVSGVLTSLDDTLEWLTWTYYFRRLAMNPSFYQLEDCSPEGVKKHLTELMRDVISDLKAAGCVDIVSSSSSSGADCDSGTIFQSTTFGEITSYYYLDYRTIGMFVENITQLTSVENCAELLSQAYEFSEVPVRHNEDILNQELSQFTPWEVARDSYGSSNTKAYLLLQAHLYQVRLPIVDYINDTKTVLDQVPRVINALIDVAADLGNLQAVLKLMKLSQLVYHGLNEDSSELLQLPGVNNNEENELLNALHAQGISTLKQITDRSTSQIESILRRQKSSKVPMINDLLRVIKDLPVFRLNSIVLKSSLKTTKELEVTLLSSTNKNNQCNDGTPTSEINTNTDYEVNVSIERIRGNAKANIYCPKYHKPKTQSWWMMLRSSRNGGELLGLKRVGAIEQILLTTIQFTSATQACSSEDLSVHIICDSIIGLDLKFIVSIQTK